MRNQITARVDEEVKHWLADYASSLALGESETVRLLILRERWNKRLRSGRNSLVARHQTMQSQVTVYFFEDGIRPWLSEYGQSLKHRPSAIIRALIYEEQRHEFLIRALQRSIPERRAAGAAERN